MCRSRPAMPSLPKTCPDAARKLIEDTGAELVFLRPYCPMIEMAFVIGTSFRQGDERTFEGVPRLSP